MGSRCFTELRVWKEAHRVALEVYRLTERYPDRERFGLTAQMRKAAVSIAANIAEGFGRCTPRDRAHFYIMARGSAQELKYYLILSRDLHVHGGATSLEASLDRACAILYRLIEAVGGGDLRWGGRP